MRTGNGQGRPRLGATLHQSSIIGLFGRLTDSLPRSFDILARTFDGLAGGKSAERRQRDQG